MRKTKIVCTMGPATDREEVLLELIESGMDVARFNFSHGSHEEQKKRMQMLCRLRKQCGRPVAMLLDTKGPEIRTGRFQNGKAVLEPGRQFTLTCRDVMGTDEIVSVTYPKLYEDEQPGSRILIDDGLVELVVREVNGEDIVCEVINGGVVSDHKGINLPSVHVNLPYMSDRDIEDILFGIEQGVDFVAASFTRTAEDVQQIRRLLRANGGGDINIIAKIENAEGVERIDEIIEASDGIMIARGDMGVEVPDEEVPVIQKMIIKKVYEAGKQVITATQMPVSYTHLTLPTIGG